jgi:hypothetical protein
MSVNHPSIVRQSLLTTVTCGVAVLIALSMLYALVNFPHESHVFLSSMGDVLAAVYEPNAAILHPLLLPGYDLLFWLIGLPMTALYVALPLYAWCYCVSNRLQVKFIRNRYTAAVDTVGTYIGVFVCFILYLKVVPLFSGPECFIAFMTVTLCLIFKGMTELDWRDHMDKMYLMNTEPQPEGPVHVV